jgi:zona occludens toxin
MIIFHEGLPRSGKSYEACINQILPTLQKGRKVFAYIDGLNHEKFSEILEKPIEWVQEHLIQLTPEQIPTVYDHVENDSLVVIDELQDFFPTTRQKLAQDITQFVTQHGHRGIDILCMGQDHRDCHNLWKRRIDTLITFVKRDAIGRPNQYTWTTFKQRLGKFEKLNDGKGTYDPKYFGLYKSHVSGVTEIDSHKDDRTNVFKSSVFKFYIPLFIVLLVVALVYLYRFFHDPDAVVNIKEKPIQTTVQKKTENPQEKKPETPQAVPALPLMPETPIDKLLQGGHRIVSEIKRPDRKKVIYQVEFYDKNMVVTDRYSSEDIEAFGYLVMQKSYGLTLIRGVQKYEVTHKPRKTQAPGNAEKKPSVVMPGIQVAAQ